MIEEILAQSRLADLQSEAARIARDKQALRTLASPGRALRRSRGNSLAAPGARFAAPTAVWPGL